MKNGVMLKTWKKQRLYGKNRDVGPLRRLAAALCISLLLAPVLPALADGTKAGRVRIGEASVELAPLPAGALSPFDMEHPPTLTVNPGKHPAALTVYNTFIQIELWAQTATGPEMLGLIAYDSERDSIPLPETDGKYAVTFYKYDFDAAGSYGKKPYGFCLTVGNGSPVLLPENDPLPYYFDREGARVTVRRDTGDSVELRSAKAEAFREAVAALDLVPASGGEAPLAVGKPFTLQFCFGRRMDAFYFCADGVSWNGTFYYPRNPAALDDLYEADRYDMLLYADYGKLSRKIPFSAKDVASLRIHWSATAAGFEELTLTDRDSISRILDAVGRWVVWEPGKIEEWDAYYASKGIPERPHMMASGSTGTEYAFTLEDGSQYTVIDAMWGKYFWRGEEQTENAKLAVVGNSGQYGIPGCGVYDEKLPRAFINGYEAIPLGFDYDGNRREQYLNVYSASEACIRPGETPVLTFSDAGGGPIGIAPEFRVCEFSRDEKGIVAGGKELKTENGALTGGWRDKDLLITAHFEKGTVNYLIRCRETDLPDTLFPIENKAPTALSISFPGRDFFRNSSLLYEGLTILRGLKPLEGSTGELLTPLPYLLRWECGDRADDFLVTGCGVLYRGKWYAPEDPEKTWSYCIELFKRAAARS